MKSREDVIKGLECCVNHFGNCENCPYEAGIGNTACGEQLFDDALALLKAREPMRPGLGIINHDDGSKSYFLHCPFDGVTLVDGDNYCRRCGREVKWE